MGELRKRGRIWWIRYYRNGHRHEESSGSKKKTEAARLLKLREGAVAKGLPVSAKVGRVRFDDAAAAVVTDYRTKGKKSVAHVERRITKHLEPYFTGHRLANITTDDVTAYVEHRQKQGAANATINRELSIVKRAFRLAEEAGKVFHAPAISMLDEENVRQGFFEEDEFRQLHAALPNYLQGLATFAYFTGWRKGEVLGLTWANVDRKARIIRLEPGTTKNQKGRTLPYDVLPALTDVIETQWAEHCRLGSGGVLCPWVFNRNGKKIGSFVKAWKAACKKVGCPGKLFHDFRRTAVRNLVRAGVSEHTAMKITGHVTRSVFDRYDIVNEDDLRAGLGKLAEASAASNEEGAGTEWGHSARVVQMSSP